VMAIFCLSRRGLNHHRNTVQRYSAGDERHHRAVIAGPFAEYAYLSKVSFPIMPSCGCLFAFSPIRRLFDIRLQCDGAIL